MTPVAFLLAVSPLAQPEVVIDAQKMQEANDHRGAASALFSHMSKAGDAADSYETAEYLLASSLFEMGYSVASAEHFFNVAKNRTNPLLLEGAMRRIRDIMSGPHDEFLLGKMLLMESELGGFPPELDSFVWFSRGLYDVQAHRLQWSARHFQRIDDRTSHAAEALYVRAVHALRRDDKPDAAALFREAFEHPFASRRLRADALLALARMLFEDGELEGALDLYERVRVEPGSMSEPSLFLEKAWTHYRLGALHEAMGMLHALEAPSFEQFHAPETFLLRTLIYKDLCQYIPARRVIRSFRREYRDTLETVRARGDLTRDLMLRRAAFQRGRLQRLKAFEDAVSAETQRIDELDRDDETVLKTHLETIYGLKQRQIALESTDLLRHDTQEIAEELVELEEQMELLDYEIGLALHHRGGTPEALFIGENTRPPKAPGVTFRFRDEFWNDELDRFEFVLDDRCIRRETSP